MKGEILYGQHTFLIDGFQIDIYFNFRHSEMMIVIEGKEFTHNHYNPAFKTFNYINLMDLACKSLDFWKTRQKEKEREMKKDAGMTENDEWEGW